MYSWRKVMTLEQQLTNKKYYESFIDENSTEHPVQILGETYFDEQKNEVYDLSFVRFAQGEVYFQYKDYESAIFKWESIKNELEPWAKKNMADAYFELGLYTNAEDIYTAILSESPVLNTEIGLQLFSLYINRGKLDKADHVIKRVVSINPDYQDVTNLARQFYEENQDWRSAVELAVNEGKRTQKLQWFTILKTYIDQEWTKQLPPEYFEETLAILQGVNHSHFEQLLSSLWKSYENEQLYLQWIKTVNHLFVRMELDENEYWYETSALFSEGFFKLISGRYFIREIEKIIPTLLSNWSKIADASHKTYVFGAVLSWNDYFPSTVPSSIVEEAEVFISQEADSRQVLEGSEGLLSDIIHWGNEQHVEIELPLVLGNQTEIWNKNESDPTQFVQSYLGEFKVEERNEKILLLIRNLLNHLLDKRTEQKNRLAETIKWNAEMLSKINGAVNQLQDLQFEKNKLIKKAFQRRKDEMKEQIQTKVPEILKGCSEVIKEDSDFGTIHVEINNEMNNRVHHYLNETMLPVFKVKFEEWTSYSDVEFKESKMFIEEMTESFNQLFGEQRLQMECDFQVLNDWRRDMDRMTNFVPILQENIFLRFTPTQFILKSAGKLLGALPQNKGFLYNQYKKLIENEEFAEVSINIANKFLQQFDLFERTIERDISMFFKNPLQVLKKTVDELETEKARLEQELHELKSNPEKFNDPITLFDLRHRQFEWMNIGAVSNYP